MPIKVTLIPFDGEKTERIVDTHTVIIGRSPKCDLSLDSESLSRQHCQIEFVDGKFFITDLNSTNGVMVDGVRIPTDKRVPFNNYLSLQISVFECQVQEVEDTAIRNPPISNSDTLSFIPHSAKKVNFKIQSRPLKLEPKQSKWIKRMRSPGTLKYLGIGLVVVMIALTRGKRTAGTDETQNVVTTPQSVSVPVQKAVDEFLSASEYEYQSSNSNCEEKMFCENLGLSPEEGEGLFKRENDFLIYFKPTRHLTKEKYKTVTDHDLIAFDHFLSSRIIDAYFVGTINQLHLIIVGEDKLVKRVYRFHPEKFNLKTVQRETLIPILHQAIADNSPQLFWNEIAPLMISKNL